MTDVFDAATRSRVMSRIKSKNTSPELILRKLLFHAGFRYRIHSKQLPGKPDITLKKHNAVIFIHGCFWHGHGCKYFKWPQTNTAFWENKIETNMRNDKITCESLMSSGWRVCIIWECRIRALKKGDSSIVSIIEQWLIEGGKFLELST